MKLTFKQIDSFVANPDPKARIILVYGPDLGLVHERARIISKTAVSDLSDPFNVISFTPEKIISDPAAFYDEVNAQSLMGGNRLIIIKDGADSLSIILKDYLENPSDNSLVVIESGNLGPKSSLRKLCEGAKNAAAVPCYVDDERNLAQIIRDMCTHAGYGINQDAILSLSSALVGDRTIARNEIEKLLLYKGYYKDYTGFSGDPVREKIGQITLDDVYACSGDIRDWSMDKLVYAIADGNIQDVHSITQSLFRDQTPSIILLRSVQNHFWRLLSVKSKILAGINQEDALKSLNPPLFFKVENDFKRQLNRWTEDALEAALDSLNRTESLVKQTGYNDVSLVENILVQLARYNPARRTA